jgi:glucose/arabinose dehydrogenase
MLKCLIAAVAAVLALSPLASADEPAASPVPAAGIVGPGVPAFKVRPGYKVTLAADKLDQVRFLELGDHGELYVSQPDKAKIMCLRDPDADGKFKTVTTFVTGEEGSRLHGLCWHNGWLWYTGTSSVHKAQSTKNDGKADQDVEIDCGKLPGGGGHWYRSILADDNGFYTSIGDKENLHDPTNDGDPDVDREKIWHYNLDGTGKKLFCSGIRNTEKLRYRPGTTEIWGCDHGSDNFGGKGGQAITDLNPPDEFNHYIQDGFYGHPFIVGNRQIRPEFADRPDIKQLAAKTIPPAWDNGAHWANDGWCFTTKPVLTGQIGDAIVAFHGSWNSSKKVGYCIQRIEFDSMTNQPCGSTTLVSTLNPDGRTYSSRPVDCVEDADGSIIFSSDDPPGIYRLTKVK